MDDRETEAALRSALLERIPDADLPSVEAAYAEAKRRRAAPPARDVTWRPLTETLGFFAGAAAAIGGLAGLALLGGLAGFLAAQAALAAAASIGAYFILARRWRVAEERP